jgi:multiple sugar transport system permease protein
MGATPGTVPRGGAAGGASRPPASLATQERRFALALLAPALLVLALTTTAPLVYLAWNSLHRIDLGMPWLSGFAGLGNYLRMGEDPRFWNSLWLTFVYTGSTVVMQVIIGLSLAILVLQIPRGQAALRIAAILPIVLAPVVVGLFWRTLVLAPDFGLVDLVTRALGLGSHNWLGDPQLALISVIAIHTWQWTPFAFLVLLATLATLPPDVYEAARLDRAGAWQRFVHITLPLIRPAIVMVVILRTMTALSAFAAIFAATGGGPGAATEILNLYAYRTSFTQLNIGYGAALAMVLLALTLAISWLMFRLRRAR